MMEPYDHVPFAPEESLPTTAFLIRNKTFTSRYNVGFIMLTRNAPSGISPVRCGNRHTTHTEET